MAYEVNGQTVECDEEGYITNLSDWSKELAAIIAKEEDLEMDDDRWEVVNFLREYYDEYQIAPAVRVLIKAAKKSMGPECTPTDIRSRTVPDGVDTLPTDDSARRIFGIERCNGCHRGHGGLSGDHQPQI